MLLGLSGGADDPVDLGVVGGPEHGDGGVAHGQLLARFAEQVHAGDVAEVRDEVVAALGPAGLVDAAAVCANFAMMVRIADGTGTPLDEGSVEISIELRDQLHLDELPSRRIVGV